MGLQKIVGAFHCLIVSKVISISKLMNSSIKTTLIIGTTGNLCMDLINEYSTINPVFLCSNFSLGISQFKKIINIIDKELWFPKLVEKHHIHKKDSPSGTAKSLLQVYNVDKEYLKNDSIVSIREGEIIGEHELILEGESETIKITHIAHNRDLFAKGCVKLIESVLDKKYITGLYM
jgi:4-hydroxy-tetrahydrodipicolinate reductase